ncbi:Flp family type IVb pilin [Vibrio salinus]|uniref:Flp family type IVb pilin n=1 Tax=Vibrio salinus TaxID=2899784 RepID=UPI001E3A45E8|nr:Flp family type IVb pilin [Vibrio salinus]MCE0494311.1 Flp family type IVb pilin [Vibrio salinus]
MNTLLAKCKAFLKDEEGLTVVEYVIGAGLLVAALTAVFSGMGNILTQKITNIITNINES